ncbi:hypothetical protein AB3R30_14525 [Leptolyngbyaceae cyanobacterium UHCC 1019]
MLDQFLNYTGEIISSPEDLARLTKQRLCCSGMRWKEAGAAVALSLRTLVLTST